MSVKVKKWGEMCRRDYSGGGESRTLSALLRESSGWSEERKPIGTGTLKSSEMNT